MTQPIDTRSDRPGKALTLVRDEAPTVRAPHREVILRERVVKILKEMFGSLRGPKTGTAR